MSEDRKNIGPLSVSKSHYDKMEFIKSTFKQNSDEQVLDLSVSVLYGLIMNSRNNINVTDIHGVKIIEVGRIDKPFQAKSNKDKENELLSKLLAIQLIILALSINPLNSYDAYCVVTINI